MEKGRMYTRRHFGRLSTASLSGAVYAGVAGVSNAAAGASAAFDPTPFVNPELRPFLPALLKMSAGPISASNLAIARSESKKWSPQPSDAPPVWSERFVPGLNGAPDVRVYVVNAGAKGAPRPAILFMHGGGFIMGDAKSAIRRLQALARSLDCIAVTVDYRLAPETPFPGALEDNYAALEWLYLHAAELGVDPGRIAVMGESAGGGHAAMLAIAARDRGEIPLVFQALIYPMLDDRTGSTHSAPPYMGVVIWLPESNRFGWSSLLGVPAGSARTPYGAVPARVDNLRGLPPTFIGVGSIDLFADEDIEYARRLVDAGVATELNVVPGAFHGFDLFVNTSIARQFNAALEAALRRSFQQPAQSPTGSSS